MQAQAWRSVDTHDVAARLKAARRHSAWVRRLRIGVPLMSIAALAGLVLWAWFDPVRLLAKLPIDPGKLVMSGTKVTMYGPKHSGFTGDNRRFDISADTAVQDVTNLDIAELTNIRGRIELADQGSAVLLAAAGTLDRATERLTLHRDIRVTTTGGHEMYLTEAVIDIRKSTIVSNQPVQLRMPGTNLTAGSLDVAERGNVLNFGGGVKMTITPGETPGGGAVLPGGARP